MSTPEKEVSVGYLLSEKLRSVLLASDVGPLLQLSAATTLLVMLAIELELDEDTLCGVVRDSVRALRARRAAPGFGPRTGQA